MCGAPLRLATAAAVACIAGATASAQQAPFIAVSPRLAHPPTTCATQAPNEQRFNFHPASALEDGRPLRFTQEPSLLTADYNGTVTLRDCMVPGDESVLRFKAFGSDAVERFPRMGVVNIGGRTVSVFAPSWPASRLSSMLGIQEYGLDYPYIVWGEVLSGGVPGGNHVWLRMAPNGLPLADVRRLADDVQYSASVVNIRLDGFANARLFEDDNASVDLSAVTRKFYEHFEDTYDTIAVVTSDTQVRGNGLLALHVNVRNAVRGIGLDRYDNSARVGSAGRLAGTEFYYGPHITAHSVAVHEAAHQWGSFIDFAKLGIARAGHQAGVHDPLMDGGETLIGAVLDGTRRVSGSTIEQTPYPIRFHPLTLYAMGVLNPDNVPALNLFAEQAQFGDWSVSAPAPGAPVSGGASSVTMASIIGAMGAREGPVPAEVQRAIVVVSDNRLLTQGEMSYWTFFAQRVADPNGSGTPSVDGYVSFDAATGGAVSMRHEIRPKAAPQIGQVMDVDVPAFARNDFRGVQFDTPVPMRFRAGQRARFAGRVAADDRNDFTAIIVRFSRNGGSGPDDLVSAQGSVDGDGRFSVEWLTFEARQRGRWMLQVFLFCPGAGSQAPRAIVGPFTVE